VSTLSRSLTRRSCNSLPRPDLREKRFLAWQSRGANGGDNRQPRQIAAETLALREERASLLGY